MLNIDRTLEESKQIIENFRPGKPGSPKPTKAEVENWMKVISNVSYYFGQLFF